MVMLGKMAAELARQGKVLDELVQYVNERARREALGYVKGGGIVGGIIAVVELLRQVGILK